MHRCVRPARFTKHFLFSFLFIYLFFFSTSFLDRINIILLWQRTGLECALRAGDVNVVDLVL